MSGDTTRDPRNPLARALDEASSGPEARAYAVPLDGVRRRARRRRATRGAGVAALALVVVAATGSGVAAGLGAWRDGPRTPGVGETVTSAADWPAQFGYCGEPVAALYTPLSSAWLALDPQTETVPADGAWSATVTTQIASVGEDLGWVWGTDLLVVRDGVVVGVQDGPQVPLVSDLDEYLGGGAPSVSTAPFPLVTDVSMGLASCGQYPSGQGEPRLAPGTYDLVVAQTVSYLRHSDGARVDTRLGTQTTVTITGADGEAGQPTFADVTACGAPVTDLAALADPQLNPMAFPVEADVAGDALAGLPLADTVSLTLGSDWGSEGLVIGDATAVLTRDGTVVGDVARGSGEMTEAFLASVPQDCSARDAATSEPEAGFPLGAGEYELWLVLAAHPTGPDAPDSLMAAGPWPVTIVDHPTPTGAATSPEPGQWDLSAAGVGPLRLGRTWQELAQDPQVLLDGDLASCATAFVMTSGYQLAVTFGTDAGGAAIAGDPPAESVTVSQGLPGDRVHTVVGAGGVTLGSSSAEVETAYPGGTWPADGWWNPELDRIYVAGTASVPITFGFTGDAVTAISVGSTSIAYEFCG